MKPSPRSIQNIYLVLTLLSTLATSFIWGVNTIFLLDAGLSNAQAFLANAFFTIGQVLFEVPTGMVADIKGRRISYLLGTLTLAASTLAYLGAWYIQAPMVIWAISSILLGLGFTFFSGATEAWLVDSLKFAGFKGKLESVFAKTQMVSGAAMLMGSVAGGVMAQSLGLGVPYVVRAVMLVLTFGVAWIFMKDWGFVPSKSKNLGREVRQLFQSSIKLGFRQPAVRWLMLAAPINAGVGFYAFYSMQPFLLQLYGDSEAYAVAGMAAAIVAAAQIIGGLCVPQLGRWFQRRTSILLAGQLLGLGLLLALGWTTNFWVAITLVSGWGLVFAATMPVRQAYLNGLIPSQQRATVLSFDSLMTSSGGVVIQPLLGRVADLGSYAASFAVGGAIELAAVPFLLLSRREKVKSDAV